jgi:hypothetical protein
MKMSLISKERFGLFMVIASSHFGLSPRPGQIYLQQHCPRTAMNVIKSRIFLSLYGGLELPVLWTTGIPVPWSVVLTCTSVSLRPYQSTGTANASRPGYEETTGSIA